MSARNGGHEDTLALLRRLGRATSTDLAAQLGVGADVVLTRLRKLEDSGKVARVGTIPTKSRPLVIWALPRIGGDGSSIEAKDSFEFEAKGGFVERLPGFVPVPPLLRPVRQVYRGSGSMAP